MDSLKSLMDKKEYELVIKLTENATEPTYLFYRISALLAAGRGEDSLNVIKGNRKLLESDLLLLVRVHLEILCLLGRFDEAYDELRYYEELPYESQRVEELLKSMPSYIRNEEKKSFGNKEMDKEQVVKLLYSDDINDSIIALDIIRDRDFKEYLNELKWVMTNHIQQSIRSFALLILVQKEFNEEVAFKSVDEITSVIPSELEPPFVGDDFNHLVKRLSLDFNNPSLSDNATQILSTYIMYIYPKKIAYSEDEIVEALYEISTNYLHEKKDGDLKQRCLLKYIDIDRVEELITHINEALEQF